MIRTSLGKRDALAGVGIEALDFGGELFEFHAVNSGGTSHRCHWIQQTDGLEDWLARPGKHNSALGLLNASHPPMKAPALA